MDKKGTRMNANELADLIGLLESEAKTTARIDDFIKKSAAAMLRQQQVKLDKYEQVIQSIANERIELSHDKIKWQCEDHIRWAKEALKMTSDEGSMKSPCVQAGHPYNRAS